MMNTNVLYHLLDPQMGMPYSARATIRSQLGMQQETAADTNAVPAPSTNPPATNSVPQ
jgi:hypothetical protein